MAPGLIRRTRGEASTSLPNFSGEADPWNPPIQSKPHILSCHGVAKHFGGLAAVKEVFFDMAENEVLGLIGPNGAGKTTLFNLIAGAIKPDKGSIYFEGRDITGFKPNVICRMGLGRTYQITKPFLQMTVLENVICACYFGTDEKRTLKDMHRRGQGHPGPDRSRRQDQEVRLGAHPGRAKAPGIRAGPGYKPQDSAPGRSDRRPQPDRDPGDGGPV